MAPKLDSNIYGMDETSFATDCSSKALNPSKLQEWEGAPTGEASSKGASKPGEVDEKGDVVVKDEACKPDSRAVSKGGHATSTHLARGK